MILIIGTIDNEKIKLALAKNDKIIDSAEIKARFKQSEKLLVGIDKLLKNNKLALPSLKKIRVANSGGSFTSLRIGVATANALGYALGIKVEPNDDTGIVKTGKTKKRIYIVEAKYSREPDIKSPPSLVC